MEDIIRKLVIKHWDSNWHDSRIIEDDVQWVMKFAHKIVQEWLKRFGKKLEKGF